MTGCFLRRLRTGGRFHCAVRIAFLSVALPFSAGATDEAEPLPLTVIALGPLDGRAVVRLDDGALRILATGDAVDGTAARMVQVLPDRAVFEEAVATPGGATVREQIWIFKADASGRSAQQRLSRTPPAAAPVQKPD